MLGRTARRVRGKAQYASPTSPSKTQMRLRPLRTKAKQQRWVWAHEACCMTTQPTHKQQTQQDHQKTLWTQQATMIVIQMHPQSPLTCLRVERRKWCWWHTWGWRGVDNERDLGMNKLLLSQESKRDSFIPKAMHNTNNEKRRDYCLLCFPSFGDFVPPV